MAGVKRLHRGSRVIVGASDGITISCANVKYVNCS
jgi:hypothetical protein